MYSISDLLIKTQKYSYRGFKNGVIEKDLLSVAYFSW